jgi:hypothetical protein
MDYEFKVIKMCGAGNKADSASLDSLQKWFDEGWEYVDHISQRGVEYPAMGVIIKKLKPNKDLI